MSISTPAAAGTGSARNGDRAASSGIFGQLIDEWSRLCQLPSLSRQLRRWSTTEPALADTASLQELLARIDEGDRDEDDAILGALIRLAHTGQTMAGRVVLQAMLPKLIRLSRTTTPMRASGDGKVEDHRHVIVATFWTILAGYPISRRTSSVAAGLALDTLHQITAAPRDDGMNIPLDPHDVELLLHHDSQSEHPAPDGPLNADSDLLEVIAWGLDTSTLSSDEAALLIRVYLPEDGQRGSAAAAAALGLSPAALRQRCSRARRRLIAAVQAEALRPHVAAPAPAPEIPAEPQPVMASPGHLIPG